MTVRPQFCFGVYLFSILCSCALWWLHDFQRQSMWLRLNQSSHPTLQWLGQGQQGPARDANLVNWGQWNSCLWVFWNCWRSSLYQLLSSVLWAWVGWGLQLQPGNGANRQKPSWKTRRKTPGAYAPDSKPYPVMPEASLIRLLCLTRQCILLLFMSVWMGLSIRDLMVIHTFPVLSPTTALSHLTIYHFLLWSHHKYTQPIYIHFGPPIPSI